MKASDVVPVAFPLGKLEEATVGSPTTVLPFSSSGAAAAAAPTEKGGADDASGCDAGAEQEEEEEEEEVQRDEKGSVGVVEQKGKGGAGVFREFANVWEHFLSGENLGILRVELKVGLAGGGRGWVGLRVGGGPGLNVTKDKGVASEFRE
ncbi:hypothetical protein M0804_003427 [Polistes exclamans]|nr:hypothetical protein M0804_003427 [Polistes exclamans]